MKALDVRRNDFDVEKGLTAIILSPTLEDAVEMLRLQGTLASVGKLKQLRDWEHERFEKRREELAPVREGIFANDLLDNASRAAKIIGIAMDQTQELLEAGKVQDPARVARDLSQVATQAIDKRLAVQGRPTQIVENRDVGQILRALQGMGVVSIESSAEEDEDAS